MIKDDFEREHLKDEMYIGEMKKREEEEWEEWESRQVPEAQIFVIYPKEELINKEDESKSDSLPF